MAIEKVYKLTIEGTDSVNELKDAIEQLNDKLKTLNETSQEYKETLEELTKLQAQLAEAMENISESAESTSESMESIKDSIADVGEVISDVSDALDNFSDFDSGAIDAFVEGFVDGLTDAVNSVDGIEEKLDELQDVDVNVNVDVDGGSIEALNDALDNIEDADVKVNVDVNQDSIDQLKETLDGIDDVDVSVNVEADENSVDALTEKLDNIDDATVKVNVETDESSIEGLTDTLENIDDVTVSVNVEANDNSVEDLKENLDSIEDANVKVNVDVDDSSIDTLTTTLDSLEDVDIEVNVKTDESPIENLSTTLESLEDADVSVTVDVNEDSLDSLTTTLDGLEDTTVSVNVTTDEGSVENLKETLENIEDVNVTVGVEVDDSSLDNLTTTLENVEDVNINVGVEVSDEQLDSLSEDITNITTEFESLNSEAEKTSETFNKFGGADSVKALKQYISDLKDKLVQLNKDSEEYKQIVQERINAEVKLKEVMNAGRNEMEAAEGSYNALSQRMSALKQVWKETTDEATRNEIGKQINEINNQLKALDSSIGNSQRNVGNYKSALEGLDAEYITQKQELKELKIAMEQMDPATQEYADAMARAAELTHNLSDQQEMIKYSSADVGDQLNNIRGIASNLAAGYSAVNAAMGLFGGENEEVAQALLKVQQAMALVQGMQGIDGFIKRTKGLSQSLGLVTKATQANTVATKANATAAKADAAAMAAETVATKAAVPAQLSLNAAMKANPIGFIVGLIATLVTAMMLLKDKIMEMIGANDNMSKAFDKVKAVLAGFGNVIKKSVINPVKMAIIPIKTLAKVMIDLFKGDWSKIGDDFKDGMKEMKDTAIDTINVVGAFKEGYDKKTAEQAEAARKAEAEARAKDRDNYIKDMEAKNNSNWKFTAEGKKAYEEYYKALLEMYDKDSEEYRQALRDKEAYLRDFNENAQKDAETLAASELKLDVVRYGESVKYSEKWYNYEKKLYQDAMKLGEKYRPPYANIEPMPPEVEQKITEAQLRWETYLKARNDYYKKQNDDLTKDRDKLVADFKSKFDSFVDDRWKAVRGFNETIQALDAELKQGGTTYKAIDEYIDKWRELFESIGSYDEETIQSILDNIRKDIISGATTNGFDIYINAMRGSLDKAFYDMDKSTETFLNNLEMLYERKKLRFGIDFPEDEIEKVTEIYNAKIDNVTTKANEVRERIKLIFTELAGQFSATTEEELAAVLPMFKKLKDEEQNYLNEIEGLHNEHYQKISDIQVKAYENAENVDKNYYSNRLKSAELWYDREEAVIEKSRQWYDGNDRIAALKREMDYENKTFNIKMEMYQKLRDRYNEMAQDQTLTAEERENAEREAVKITSQIFEEEMDHETQLLKTQKEIIKEWAYTVKNATSDIGSIMSSLADSWESMINLEKEAIETELENGDIREDEAKRREEANKESFEKLKAFQVATTIINTIAGAIGAFLQASNAYPPPWGQILGGVSAAAVAAAGYAQVRQIQATQYGSSSSSAGGGSSSTNFQLPDVLETEPQYVQNQTNMNDTDDLNNDGSGNGDGDGRGRGETRVYVVESDISNALNKSNKRKTEVTF